MRLILLEFLQSESLDNPFSCLTIRTVWPDEFLLEQVDTPTSTQWPHFDLSSPTHNPQHASDHSTASNPQV